MCDWNSFEGEAVQLGALLERGNRFLAIRAVVIDKAYLLALELVKAAEFLSDVLDGDVRSGPVAADRNEVPRKDCAVAAFRTAITHSQKRYLVTWNLFSKREGDAG